MHISPHVAIRTIAFPARNFLLGASKFGFHFATVTTDGVFAK